MEGSRSNGGSGNTSSGCTPTVVTNNKRVKTNEYHSNNDGQHDMHPSSVCHDQDLSLSVTPTVSSSPSSCCSSNHDIINSSQRHKITTLSKKEMESLLWNEAKYDPTSSVALQPENKKRLNYISWDDYFMATAVLSSFRSKAPYNATGACLVDKFNRIVGTGYNGFPTNCNDDILPWNTNNDKNNNNNNKKEWLHTYEPYMVHAEINTILNKCASDCYGTRLYTQNFPCNECTKVIIQAGISEIIYMNDNEHSTDSCRASRILLTMAGIKFRKYKPNNNLQKIILDFSQALDPNERIDKHNNDKELDNNQATKVEMEEESDTFKQHRELMIKEANYDPMADGVTKRRQNYLSWDDYFLSMAFLTAQRSKDPNTQVGACIVDSNKHIVGLGYNGFPYGADDDILPWARTSADNLALHTKYMYVCHAEQNAILNKGTGNVRNGTIYVALFPCNECAKVIIQAGIREVVYMSDRYHNTDICRASRILFNMANVKLRQYIPKFTNITIQLIQQNDNNNNDNNGNINNTTNNNP